MKKLNYTFKDKTLFDLAMTQSGADAVNNNERLEFIGDRVLGLSVVVLLYEMFPLESEGELARRHASLVSTETLGNIAKEMGFEKKIRHGHMTGGRLHHILANAMEATLGAIYLDGGFEAVRKLVVEIWRPLAAAELVAPKDPKTSLQEFVQKENPGTLPEYEFLPQSGTSHSPVFNVRVSALGKNATASGISKKTATAAAAMELMKQLV